MSVVSSYRSSQAPSLAVRRLSLENQALRSLPEELERRVCEEKINELSLARNHLSPLPPAIAAFTGLRKLDVSANGLIELPDQLCELNALEVLLLKRNSLKCLPKSFQLLRRLRELNLSGNNLEKFPEEILSLVELEVLHLGGNRLRAIPGHIGQLQQ